MSLLSVRDLSKSFGGLAAVDGVSFSLRPGELLALIGPNGAGKTTLIQQLAGDLRADAGQIVLKGEDITHLSTHERVHRGLARSFQITRIFERLPVLDNLALALQAVQGSSMRFWFSARGEAQRYQQAAALAERVGLGTELGRAAGTLSHGQQRQLEVGMALAGQPHMLLLDEPMAGMGAEESERMVTLLQGLRGHTTLLLVEHDMDAVFRLADTLSVLVSGRVIASGPPDVVRVDPQVRRAYLGDDFELAENGR